MNRGSTVDNAVDAGGQRLWTTRVWTADPVYAAKPTACRSQPERVEQARSHLSTASTAPMMTKVLSPKREKPIITGGEIFRPAGATGGTVGLSGEDTQPGVDSRAAGADADRIVGMPGVSTGVRRMKVNSTP